MDDEYKTLLEFASELGLSLDKDIIDNMYRLLDAGMSPNSLIQLTREIRRELSEGETAGE